MAMSEKTSSFRIIPPCNVVNIQFVAPAYQSM